MRLHTDTLTLDDVRRIARETLPGDVEADVEEHGSRKRKRAFEVRLNAAHGRDRLGKMRRASNSGTYGANSYRMAPTWHEWGDFIAGVFRGDQVACFGTYDGVAEFLDQTRKYDPAQRDTPLADRVSPWLEEVEPERVAS